MTTEDEIEARPQGEGTYRLSTESGRSVTGSIIEAVAAVSGRNPVTDESHDRAEVLEPLYDTVDPDALDALLASTPDDAFPPTRVEFTYCGYHVAADSTGLVTVTDR